MFNLIPKALKLFAWLFIVHCSLFIVNCYAQQPTEEWVARWPGNASNESKGVSVKADSLGFIYVLADTAGGFGFLKYSTNGALLFSAHYKPIGYDYGGGSYFDVAPDGTVYVNGIVSISLNYWMYTVKFTSTGSFQWAKFFAPGSGVCSAGDMKIDKAGNVVVVGSCYNGFYSFILKYNPNGDSIWVRYFNGGLNLARNNRLVTDDLNYIYTTGTITSVGKCLVMKYNSFGDQIWYRSFTLEQGRTNGGDGINLDDFGNIYVIGVQARAGPYDSFLAKLNNNGDSLWIVTYPNYATGNRSLWGPVISSNGSEIYYAASVSDSIGSGISIATIKHNSSGDLQWSKTYNGGIQNALNLPADIRLDKYGSIYVCGLGYFQNTGDDFITIKYLPSGILQWVAKYTGVVQNGGDYANSVIIDTGLSVFVTGISRKLANTYYDEVTIKYNQPVALVSGSNEMPNDFELFQNYPNPFNSTTIIEYHIPKTSKMNLSLFELTGKRVRTFVNIVQNAGFYTIAVNMSEFASGVYFYRLNADEKTIETKKLILTK